MKLALIVVVWDDYEILYHQISHFIKNKLVDKIIVVYSEVSNFGERSEYTHRNIDGVEFINFEPNITIAPSINERNKRNFGLNRVKQFRDITHFLMADSDEFYCADQFLKEKEKFFDNKLSGLVCASQVYFKSPTLTVGMDTTLVPFIHKLTQEIKFTWNTKYPFAFEGPKRSIRIDPTRQYNINSGVEWSEIIMHHYSYVRRDLQKKIRNSTARENIQNSTLVHDYMHAKEGEICQFYNKKLARCPNLFGLPEM